MNTEAVLAQSMDALQLATTMRVEGARQRNDLIGKPIGEVVPALIDPTPELASVRLGHLFALRGKTAQGPIPRVGIKSMHRAFLQLIEEKPRGRQFWHTELRLRDLTQPERRRLVRALVRQAPAAWREAA